jgi:hypothetical protein
MTGGDGSVGIIQGCGERFLDDGVHSARCARFDDRSVLGVRRTDAHGVHEAGIQHGREVVKRNGRPCVACREGCRFAGYGVTDGGQQRVG